MKINTVDIIVPMIVGYWIGQTQHGFMPVIYIIIFTIIDRAIIRFVVKTYKNKYAKNIQSTA